MGDKHNSSLEKNEEETWSGTYANFRGKKILKSTSQNINKNESNF
jgi:hypothetical protein